MKKKMWVLCASVIMVSLILTIFGVKGNGNGYANLSEAGIQTYAAEATTSIGGFVSEKVDDLTNLGDVVSDASDVVGDLGGMLGGGGLDGIGDIFGGLGDGLGNILGGIGDNKNTTTKSTTSVTYSINTNYAGYIDPVPYASTSAQAADNQKPVNETVDFAATQNPYKKPTGTLKGGDKGDGVKWMQWVFIYTRYGLKDDGITGVFDEDTIAVVKKLQKEKGLVVNGVVNDEVIAQIELLYFQATHSVTVAQSDSQVSVSGSVVTVGATESDKDDTGVKILAIVVAAIWVLVIAFAVVLFVMKKKKKKKAEGKEKTKEKTKESESKASE
jgi:large-conductance mechanosensitive channel